MDKCHQCDVCTTYLSSINYLHCMDFRTALNPQFGIYNVESSDVRRITYNKKKTNKYLCV